MIDPNESEEAAAQYFTEKRREKEPWRSDPDLKAATENLPEDSELDDIYPATDSESGRQITEDIKQALNKGVQPTCICGPITFNPECPVHESLPVDPPPAEVEHYRRSDLIAAAYADLHVSFDLKTVERLESYVLGLLQSDRERSVSKIPEVRHGVMCEVRNDSPCICDYQARQWARQAAIRSIDPEAKG